MSADKRLIIIDDGFPSMLTGFRIAEFSYYLKNHHHSEIHSAVLNFDKMKAEYAQYYPDLAHKVKLLDPNLDLSGSVVYLIFLHNAFFFLPLLEHYMTPFVFTLCDGAYFHLNDPHSDMMLQTVFSSPYFRKVIIPIDTIYDYVINKGLVSPEKAEFIPGIITQAEYWEKNLVPKKFYKKDKNTFDICFIAHKYKDGGSDKGYDTFVEAATRLVNLNDNIRFHIVGGYDENDCDLSAIRSRTILYGKQYPHFFPEFYAKMDIYLSLMTLSPEKKLHPGRVAGVCNTTAVQTALNGVAVFGIYSPDQMQEFTDGKDFVIIPDDINGIVDTVRHYYNDLAALYRVSTQGQKKFADIFSEKNTAGKRLEVIKQFLI